MRRYVEIIFDDSGSMNSALQGEPKHIIAKRLFKEKIIPKLNLKTDAVYLRTLSSSCGVGYSRAIQLENDITKITNIIDAISCTKDTPLYYTIKDSIDACKNVNAEEKHIFILTDGDDTCFKMPEAILGNDFLKIKNQLNLKTILVQFAISSSITKNNLTAFSQIIGATNVIIESNEIKDLAIMDKKISKALIRSGLNTDVKFPHCDTLNSEAFCKLGDLLDYDFYLVQLLHMEKFLSWKPTLRKWLSASQFMELEFLYALRFRNNIPENQVRQMLLQLQKPYQYSFDCIYWDFKARTWKYFPEMTKLETLPNPDARLEDYAEMEFLDRMEEKDNSSELYEERQCYIVKHQGANEIKRDGFYLLKSNLPTEIRPLTVKEGDRIEFTTK